MKLFKLCLLLCFFSSTIYAQSNYHEGFVLKNNGDTVKGYINYHEWTLSPKIIDFKADKDHKDVVHFRPDEIKEFRIIGMETFVSYIGIISNNKTNFPNYPEGLDTSKVLDTIFLQQIATGNNLTLYYNNDKVKMRFFIAEKHTKPEELKYYIYYNEGNQVVTAPVFNRQLQQYVNQFAPGNQKLINKLKNTEYDQSHLTNFINNLNGIDAGKNTTRGKQSRFYIGAAISSTTAQYSQPGSIQKSTSVSPKINLGVDLFNNPNVQQFIFRAEFSLWYVMPRFNSLTTINDAPVNAVYEFNQYTASITPQILINIYNTDNFKFYLDGGWAFNISKYTNDMATVKNQDAATTTYYTVKKPLDLSGFWSSFPLQAGVVINKKVEIYASYSFYAAYTKYESLSIANKTINAGFKFYLK